MEDQKKKLKNTYVYTTKTKTLNVRPLLNMIVMKRYNLIMIIIIVLWISYKLKN